ncbi:MAG TPA: glycosyltransferase family 4 protein [Candidatus Lustribacter sp.]|nr:glycosyltransferase family 4 protein [Candidatus Lustribacter sp.]
MNAPRMLFLGSYPPRECGIATFTKDVVDSYDQRFLTKSAVISIEEPGAPQREYPPAVVASLIQDDRESYRTIAEFVNAHTCEALNVQHEYGLFGGDNGEWIDDLIALVRKPVIVSLHTVLPEPSPDHMRVARTICATASGVVVLSATGRDILIERYGIDPQKVSVIHHGVPDVPLRDTSWAKATLGLHNHQVISTFGLINRGKGLEYAIEAMRDVAAAHPDALYLILGQTHPVVRRHEGEVYRESLEKLIAEYGLAANVRLVDRYLGFEELVRYLQATDIYLTPYLNPVQIVSGTLAYAVGIGKAIVSTPYLYAEELLAHGRGFLVNFRDGVSIAKTVNALFADRDLRVSTERRAYRFGRMMTWPHVAMEYGSLFDSLLPQRLTALATSA